MSATHQTTLPRDYTSPTTSPSKLPQPLLLRDTTRPRGMTSYSLIPTAHCIVDAALQPYTERQLTQDIPNPKVPMEGHLNILTSLFTEESSARQGYSTGLHSSYRQLD
ncbi:hypothetical protein TWF481_009031 [Arthrobotrys musiformis]|uniref:Uncharacterized protein n=1 Tax=Arthrobotrys musiformis TaxID=47236 RepID=A0AAV9W2J2_9PEZI